MMLRDAKQYRNSRFRRNQKFVFKDKLYFIQYKTTNKNKLKQAREYFLKKGFKDQHIKILSKKNNGPKYIITYQKPPKEFWFKSLNYSLAQSKLRAETHLMNSDYSAQYFDLHSGVEINSDHYAGKVMGRLTYLSEVNEFDSFKTTDFELDETYLNRELGAGQLTVGKQLFSWGVFDEFSNFDRVNLKNLPRFIFDSGEKYRRPITAFRYEYYKGSWKIDSFYNLGLESGKILDEKSIWFGVNREEGIIRGGDTSLLDPSLIKLVDIHSNDKIDSGYGIRVSRTGTGDLSFTYLKSYADLPILKFSDRLRSDLNSNFVTLDGLDEGVELVFVNEDVLGVDYVQMLGDHLYKLEFSYIPNSPVVDKTLDLTEVAKYRISIGGDIEINWKGTTIVWQMIHEEVIDDTELFLDDTLTQGILQSSSRFMTDKLSLGLRTVLNFNDNSFYLSPFTNYDFRDAHNFGVSYHYFTGDNDSFFGYHEDHSFLALKYNYIF